MVVSVDISGVLEERLRRLVDIGLYASVAEAVRDGVRRLLRDIDLVKLAVELYEKRNVTLRYACYFSGISCDDFIDKLIINNVYPLIGEIKYRDTKIPKGSILLLFSSSIYVAFKSELANYLSRLWRAGYVVAVPEPALEYYHIMEAYSLVKGILREEVKVEIFHGCGKLFRGKVKGIVMASDELESLKISGSCSNVTVVVDDIRLREFLTENGFSSVSSVLLLKNMYDNNIITNNELNNIMFSMKSIPLLIPPRFSRIT